jgi:SpoVK/Ycf46/Vps4 family AAA+-type ATPase
MRIICKKNFHNDQRWRFETPESLYVARNVSRWLVRLSEHGAPLEAGFFEALSWSNGGVEAIARYALAIIKGSSLANVNEVTEAINALRDYDSEKDRRYPFFALAKRSKNFAALDSIVREAIRSVVGKAIKKMKPGVTSYSIAKKRIRRFFGLSEGALELCELFYFREAFDDVRNFMDSLDIFNQAYRKLLAATVGRSTREVEEGLSELASSGFIDMSVGHMTICDEIFMLWDNSCNEKTLALFCRPLRGKTLSLDSFTISETDMSHVFSLLKTECREPLHILFYGLAGTGKSTCAASLAKALGLKAWAVPPFGLGAPRRKGARMAALTACLNMASRNKGAFVLLDEAESILNTNDMFEREKTDKAWINDIMERPGVRMIWIANDVCYLDDSVKRRFTYSVNFESLGVAERRNIWARLLKNNRAKNRLSDDAIEKFAYRYDIPPSMMESAICQAKAVGGGDSGFAETAERVILSYVTLKGNGRQPKYDTRDMEKFTPEGACIDGAIDEFLDRCQVADAKKRERDEFPPGGATMLFYGPSGTGKSALARYLSYKLGRKLIVKKTSDLLGPYVGQTEQLIADAFRQTEREEGVLLIDEADSFLFSRDMAVRSWENSMVNEFLTSLEECREFCVCTTNRMDDLDSAALRRFSFKIPFTYAKPAQTEKLYAIILAELVEGPIADTDIEKLSRLSYLTPGDFHVVRNRNWLAPKGSLTHTQLIAALADEQNAKLERTARQVGFAVV